VPEKLDKHIEIMKKENIAFSYSSYKIRDRDGEIEKEQIRILKKVFYKNLLRKTIIATPTVVIDRNILGDFYMPNRRTGQDYALWLSLLRNNNFAYGIKESLVIVQKRSYSLSSNKFQSLKDVWEIQTKIENINRINVFFNTILYVINTIKKRIF
jgi:teichuronic acid biosynthesis glycosyltransferase TuaG